LRYINAADILPKHLLEELQMYVDGEILYIPKASSKEEWGAVNGSRIFCQERNKEIKRLFQLGLSIDALADQYGLAYSTIKKIVYC